MLDSSVSLSLLQLPESVISRAASINAPTDCSGTTVPVNAHCEVLGNPWRLETRSGTSAWNPVEFGLLLPGSVTSCCSIANGAVILSDVF
jgi:hypothetical protein